MPEPVSAAPPKGPTSTGSSTAEPDYSYAVPNDFLETVEKFVANPSDEAVKKPFEELLTKAKTQSSAKAEALKKAEEAAKNQPPPDFTKVKLPEGTKLTGKHLEKVLAFAKEAKLSPEAATAVLNRDNDVINDHVSGIEADFKKYGEEAQKKLQTEWGDKYKENIANANKVVEHYEKLKPGFKAEIERMGLSNSYTANQFFKWIFDTLSMGNDKFEFSGTPATQKGPLERNIHQQASKLFSKSMAQSGEKP